MTPAQFKAARKSLELNQHELAALWSMGKNGERTIRRWEKGEVPMNQIAAFCLKLMLKHDDWKEQVLSD